MSTIYFANIAGGFTGWRRGMIVTLDDGTAWRVVGSEAAQCALQSHPRVTLMSEHGRYYLNVLDFCGREVVPIQFARSEQPVASGWLARWLGWPSLRA